MGGEQFRRRTQILGCGHWSHQEVTAQIFGTPLNTWLLRRSESERWICILIRYLNAADDSVIDQFQSNLGNDMTVPPTHTMVQLFRSQNLEPVAN